MLRFTKKEGLEVIQLVIIQMIYQLIRNLCTINHSRLCWESHLLVMHMELPHLKLAETLIAIMARIKNFIPRA